MWKLLVYHNHFNLTDYIIQNLPALVLKIMKGAYEPIKPSYSSNIANLFKWMVTLDPQKRPYMKDIIALPFLQSYIIDAQFQMGRLEPFNQNSCK